MITPEIAAKEFLFPIPPVHHQVLYNGQFWFGHGEFFAPNPPSGAVVTYILPSAIPGGVPITIADASGKTIRTLHGPAQAGLNRACWDLRESPPIADPNPAPVATCITTGGGRGAAANPVIPPSGQVPGGGGGGGGRGGRGGGPVVLPGRYTVAVASLKQEVTVEPDPHFTISDADRKKRQEAILSAYSIQQQLVPARDAARTLTEQMAGLRQYFSAVSAKASLEAIDKVTPEITRVQGADRSRNRRRGAGAERDGRLRRSTDRRPAPPGRLGLGRCHSLRVSAEQTDHRIRSRGICLNGRSRHAAQTGPRKAASAQIMRQAKKPANHSATPCLPWWSRRFRLPSAAPKPITPGVSQGICIRYRKNPRLPPGSPRTKTARQPGKSAAAKWSSATGILRTTPSARNPDSPRR